MYRNENMCGYEKINKNMFYTIIDVKNDFKSIRLKIDKKLITLIVTFALVVIWFIYNIIYIIFTAFTKINIKKKNLIILLACDIPEENKKKIKYFLKNIKNLKKIEVFLILNRLSLIYFLKFSPKILIISIDINNIVWKSIEDNKQKSNKIYCTWVSIKYSILAKYSIKQY
jgi:hypothetical protein